MNECVMCERTHEVNGTLLWLNRDGFCPRCQRIIGVSVELGLEEIARYLAAHAAYESWCAQRGIPA